ncbi:hypothetical protein [Thermodesulforhabdus norvegica]|uniref:Uncharacterized protein n=1 Tax=Thermodesulforhabdus norvegica TaxID=39841 RepID=A0A1I4V4W4_9BACT|nr:hypothetical protein [Thermodesulforhabdus norvegica]SFM96236.1 hypothetical protein SAMN05660836_02109 [Thermodesulforhabdus norvegica]
MTAVGTDNGQPVFSLPGSLELTEFEAINSGIGTKCAFLAF